MLTVENDFGGLRTAIPSEYSNTRSNWLPR
jgi:hypothetical protein